MREMSKNYGINAQGEFTYSSNTFTVALIVKGFRDYTEKPMLNEVGSRRYILPILEKKHL